MFRHRIKHASALIALIILVGCSRDLYEVGIVDEKIALKVSHHTYGPKLLHEYWEFQMVRSDDGSSTMTMGSDAAVDTTASKTMWEKGIDWLGKIGYAIIGFLLGGR